MATIKRQKADGTWEYLQQAGRDVEDLAQKALNADKKVGEFASQLAQTMTKLPYVTPAQFKNSSDTDDTSSYKQAILEAKNNKLPLLLYGTYTMVDGINPITHELEDLVIVSEGAVINASGLTADNVVLQLGKNVSIKGHLTINVTNTSGNGNGFVRLPINIGRWWQADYVVSNVNTDALTLSNSYDSSNLIAIGANSQDINIKTINGEGNFARALLIHWGGVPNAINPTVTYHPNNIKVGHIISNGAKEAIATLSACYNVEIENLTGHDNYRGLFAIAGDFANKFANEEQKDLVGYGIKVKRVSGTKYGYRAIDVVGRAGLLNPDYVIDLPVEVCSGVCFGSPTSNNGISTNHSIGGLVENVIVKGFGNGISPLDGTKDWVFKNVKATENRASGFRLSTGTGNLENITLDNVVSENNNKDLAGGVSEILIGNNAKRTKVINPTVKTNNSATNGITTEGTATDSIIEQGTASGFSGSRFAYRSMAIPNNNNMFKDNHSDNANNHIADNGNPVFVRRNEFGRRVFVFANVPTVGTYMRGDEIIYPNPAAGGKRGLISTTAGTPGTWREYGAIDA